MWTEHILHVDMDSFFVEVERLEQPHLVGRPVAVGGTGKRGVVASASYEARRLGVHSAQPTAVALRHCPDLIVISPAHARYGDFSARVFDIFHSFTPMVEGLSLDEAFLDVIGLRHHFESPLAVGTSIREKIRTELGLPASVGIASTKFVAKLASEHAKPDGIKHVRMEEQIAFLHGLGVDELWGVGPATLAGLQRLGIETVGDLAAAPEPALASAVGPSLGAHLLALARGEDPRKVEPQDRAKQISVEETYQNDLVGRDLVESAMMAHAQRLATRLRRSTIRPRTITIKVRYDDFTTVSRSRTQPSPIDGARDIFHVARGLLDEVPAGRPVRLLGISASTFDGPENTQRGLFQDDDSWRRVDEALADVEDRFGSGQVSPARLIGWRQRDRRSLDE